MDQNNNYPIEQVGQPKNQRNLIIALACIAIALLLGIAGYLYYSNARTQKEINEWNAIERSHDMNQINNFINEFPNGKYLNQAKARLAFVQDEIATWNDISSKDDVVALQQFLEKYTEGQYHDLAAEKLKVLQDKIYSELHSTATLQSLMNDMANCYNSRGRDSMVAIYGSQRFKDTYAKYGHDTMEDGCYLLQVDYSDGEMSIKGNSVTNITDNSCELNFVTYYNGPEIVEKYGTAKFSLILDNNKWVIDDIKEDGYKASFMNDPKSYRHYNP